MIRKQNKLQGFSLSIALLASVLASPAMALGIGEARVESFLGEPLRVRVPLTFGVGENITGACVRIAAPPGKESPFIDDLAKANFQMIETPRGAELLITTRRPYTDPILVFPLKVGCGAGGIYRELSLLVDPPGMAAPAQAARAAPARPAPAPAATTPQVIRLSPRDVARSSAPRPATPPPAELVGQPGNGWRVKRGQTLSGIIASSGLDGGDRRKRWQLVEAVVAANPDVFKGRGADYLPAGALITIPGWKGGEDGTPPAAVEEPKAAEQAPAEPPAAPAEKKTEEEFRLELIGEKPAEGAAAITPEMQRIQAELERLNSASEEERKANAELQDRLLELRQQAAELQLLAERLARESGAAAEAAAGAQPGGAAEPASVAPAAEGTTAPVAQEADAPSAPTPQSEAVVNVTPPSALTAPPPPVQPPAKQAPLTETLTEYMLPLAALAFVVMVAVAWMIRRSRGAGDALPTLDEMMAQREVETKVGRKEDTEALPPMSASPPEVGDQDLMAEADSSHYIFSVEEVDSLLEQAEVLLLFGEPAKAIVMIEEYLDGPGRESKDPRPWLKLFQLLRTEERRTEFEQRAEMFKRRYNIEKPSWMMYTPEGMLESGADLEEGCPHILNRIEEMWTRPADVVDYLEALLLDDRDGAREGFPQLIAEDLLTLRDLAREHAEG